MIRLLCLADVHFGRTPSRQPDDGAPIKIQSAWDAAIDFAIQERVDAVVIAGDLFDNRAGALTAHHHIQQGFALLHQAQIPVVLTAGNHDFEATPRLVEALDTFDNLHFLGKGGLWTYHDLTRDQQPILRIYGWSFTSDKCRTSPIERFPTQTNTNLPTIALCHGIRDQSVGDYAPLMSSAMRGLPVDAWVLGHIHAPDIHPQAQPPIFYTGSLQGLDPGEPNLHGGVLMTIETGKAARTEMCYFAPLAYIDSSIDVTGEETLEDVLTRIRSQLTDQFNDLINQHSGLQKIIFRTTLVGTLSLQISIQALETALQAFQPIVPSVHRVGYLDRVIWMLTPDLDVTKHLDGDDVIAFLARILATLEGKIEATPEITPIIEESIRRFTDVHRLSDYHQVDAHVDERIRPTELQAREALEQAVRLNLLELLDQTPLSN
ncbi:MAG: DNA repair exonuclease [Bacteroidetes bacterium]|jgi:DNA repair exonuclease SbcCD nuclease subunit|nr:DNA repair exonuclease [Bacteroidota bacterium]